MFLKYRPAVILGPWKALASIMPYVGNRWPGPMWEDTLLSNGITIEGIHDLYRPELLTRRQIVRIKNQCA